ncbi:hypothetical protein [Paenibacillus soyae]|uniref:Uncharacterized protein n=1 Tax=Paenibacillus soyae TaxID=2969249 RepID=A0A9X2S9G2_9BACL|nr:hypothetical protein [Paenibacillus soyae]MCR2803513.1 hypothetical protein [Paenibacillus soyae]
MSQLELISEQMLHVLQRRLKTEILQVRSISERAPASFLGMLSALLD